MVECYFLCNTHSGINVTFFCILNPQNQTKNAIQLVAWRYQYSGFGFPHTNEANFEGS